VAQAAAGKVGKVSVRLLKSGHQQYREPVYENGVRQAKGIVRDLPPGVVLAKIRATRNSGLKFWTEYEQLALEKCRLELDEAARLRNSSQLPQIAPESDNVLLFSSDVSVVEEALEEELVAGA
jgi:hypothetical protein